MTLREIRMFGDPVLSTRANDISEFGHSLEVLAADMLETMDASGGVGLAANQIGLTSRIFVYDCTGWQAGLRGAVVNPVWEPVGDAVQVGPEGCLSIPDVTAETARYNTVKMTGFDVYGREVSMIASGLMARCIQHETDHLDGVLFLQRLQPDVRKEAMATIHASDWFNS